MPVDLSEAKPGSRWVRRNGKQAKLLRTTRLKNLVRTVMRDDDGHNQSFHLNDGTHYFSGQHDGDRMQDVIGPWVDNAPDFRSLAGELAACLRECDSWRLACDSDAQFRCCQIPQCEACILKAKIQAALAKWEAAGGEKT